VATIAHQFAYGGLPIDDLIEEGNLGLMEAADRFDPENGARFSTYASWWIKRSIRRAIYNQSRTVRVPQNVHEMSQKMSRVAECMQNQTGAEPTSDEMAECTGVSRSRLEQIRCAFQPIQSLDAEIEGDEEGSTVSDFIPDTTAEIPCGAAINHERRRQLEQALHILPERELNVVTWRYGLSDTEPLTLDEIGVILGVSRERVRQLQVRACTKLTREISSLDSTQTMKTPSPIPAKFHDWAIPA
jgi:RNA polymerase primary sigma factor